jgi:hypothetical protein
MLLDILALKALLNKINTELSDKQRKGFNTILKQISCNRF